MVSVIGVLLIYKSILLHDGRDYHWYGQCLLFQNSIVLHKGLLLWANINLRNSCIINASCRIELLFVSRYSADEHLLVNSSFTGEDRGISL